MKRIQYLILLILLSFLVVSCGTQPVTDEPGQVTSSDEMNEPTSEDPAESSAPVAEPQASPVVMTFLSNLPDRNTGQGKLEQDLMNRYVSENPNVSFELETLKDSDYDMKIKAYVASNAMPDFFFMQGMKSKIMPLRGAGVIHGFDPAEFESYGFIAGALDAFTMDGKVYGLPRNSDFSLMYYNQKLFDDHGITVPNTWSDLMTAVASFNDIGVTPIAAAHKEGWTQGLLLQDIMVKVSGDQRLPYEALERETTFAGEPDLLEAVNVFQELVEAGGFQKSHVVADYNAAKNLFTQGKAAMFYMGGWEMGMAVDMEIDASIRENIHVMSLPAAAGKGMETDMLAWMASGYSVSENSENSEAAIRFFKWIMSPENWSREAWATGACFPAQRLELNGSETVVQKEMIAIMNSATSVSGTPFMDAGSPRFKEGSTSIFQEIAAVVVTPEKALEKLDQLADEE